MKTRLFIAILCFLILSGTVFAQKTVDEIVAYVNGDIILKSELTDADKELRDQLAQDYKGAQLDQAYAVQVKDLLRNLIDTDLLMQQAADMGLNAELDVVKAMEKLRQQYFPNGTTEDLEKFIVQNGMAVDDFKQKIRRDTLTQEVARRDVYPRVVITTEELRNYYDAHKQEFDRPAGIQLSEIMISTEGKLPGELAALKKKADDALAAVKQGDNFGDVAQKYSDAQSANNGGDLGFIEKGQLAKPLEDALTNIEKGKTTEVLTMPYGYHILKVEQRHDGGILPFEIAQDEIQNKLFGQKAFPKLREYLTKLRTDGFVKINPGYVDTGAAPSKTSESIPAKN